MIKYNGLVWLMTLLVLVFFLECANSDHNNNNNNNEEDDMIMDIKDSGESSSTEVDDDDVLEIVDMMMEGDVEMDVTEKKKKKENPLFVLSALDTANLVAQEFTYAYSAYQKYAWGHDELLPLTFSYVDYSEGKSTLWTPIDGLDTMYVMNLTSLAEETKNYICYNFSFSINAEVAEFDMVIRLLGGLLSSYYLSGDDCLLDQAIDLADRIYPLFVQLSPSGFPWLQINLQTGFINNSQHISNPAIVGTLILEFGCLTYLTKDPKYYNAAKKSLQLLENSQSPLGFVGGDINLTASSPAYLWADTTMHIDAGIDSYIEYLLKCWKLFGDANCYEWWNQAVVGILTYLSDDINGRLWFKRVNMYTGAVAKGSGYKYDLYAAFFAAELALNGQIDFAEANQNANWAMWEAYDIEPELFNFRTNLPVSLSYTLNPENIESNYYLYVLTNQTIYYNRAVEYLNDLITYCKCGSTCAGYSGLRDIVSKRRGNNCASYFFAETMKYLYLTFMYNTTLTHTSNYWFNFNDYIFNTEAHPFPKVWGDLTGIVF